MLDFYKTAYPKARKEYACDLCGNKIHVGETYHRFSGKYDGDMFDLKHHLTCQRIIKAYCRAHSDDEYNNDEIEDWLRDTYCYDCEQRECNCEQLFETRCPEIRKHYMQEE